MRPREAHRVHARPTVVRSVLLLLAAVFLVSCGGGEDAEPRPFANAEAGAVDAADASITDVVAEPLPDAAGCLRKTCAQLDANCGTAPDGCGGIVSCGTCPTGQLCGGDGPNRCGMDACSPKSCVQLDASCGYVSDTCSEAIDCGGCPAPLTCEGAGEPNRCGCSPKTCTELGASCGRSPDGCGGVIECGTCQPGTTCGGGGPNLCGSEGCAPKSCAQVGAACGIASDGCSDVIDCGGCPEPSLCGGAGTVNQCGCTPKTCIQVGASCGTTSDRCGGSLNCGACPNGEVCGSSGVPNQCGCNCDVPHAQAVCNQGQCEITGCDDGWADCNDSVTDGCEVRTDDDPNNCGSCGNACNAADPNGCWERSCVLGSCSQLAKPSGATCSDNNACTTVDTCDGAGTCVAGTAKPCNTAPPGQCHAAVGSCDPATGACSYAPEAAGTPCNADNDACTQSDACDGAGTCVAGAAKTCDTPPNAQCYDTAGTCAPATGTCSYTPKSSGTACDADGNACTQNDACNASGTCVAGTPKTCNTPPNAQCYDTAGTCAPATGNCSYTTKSAGTACNADSNACTQNDACNASGTCVAGANKVCNTPPNTQCYDTAGTCAPATGNCSYTTKSAGTACNADSNACTLNDACNASGTCVAGTPKVCNTPPNTLCYNTTGTCAPATGNCSYTIKSNGTSCGTCKECSSGNCVNSATGTLCGNACTYCSAGSCLTRGQGYQYDAVESHRCCSGTPVDISTNASHCGGCGLACGTGTCQSVATTTACNPHPASTSGRCTCTSGTQCPLGRNGLRQTCRNVSPAAWLCAPSTAEYCATGESYQDVSSCPNYCYYP